jgi:hypothetical protein
MRVRFSRANAETNGFDVLGSVCGVGPDDFARMRAECEAQSGDDDDICADLMSDPWTIVDTVLLSRQMHARAASALKLR